MNAAHRCTSLIVGLLALGLAIQVPTRAAANQALLEFAQCIKESGATFYGAHWCPYCAKQLEEFGPSAYRLPYTECFRSGSRDRLAKCDHIKSFPTWEFEDGTVRTGYQSFAKLANLTGCRAP